MPITCDVTRRRLTLGTRDTITGWRAKTWEDRTISGILVPGSSLPISTLAGTYVRSDALFSTMDGLLEGEEIETATGQFYEVKTMKERYMGNSFAYRDCELTLLSMHADVDYSTYTGTFLVDDARHRQKAFLDFYWTAANCEDDTGTALGTIVMYANPDYPLSLELKEPSALDVIITVDKATSKPLRGHDFIPYGYEETVPVDIWSMNKTGVTAVKAVQQCETELRSILETYYAQGSLRGFDKTSDGTKVLGSATLYNAHYSLVYSRDTT